MSACLRAISYDQAHPAESRSPHRQCRPDRARRGDSRYRGGPDQRPEIHGSRISRRGGRKSDPVSEGHLEFARAAPSRSTKAPSTPRPIANRPAPGPNSMANNSEHKKPSSRPDIATLGGLLLAAGGILGGLLIEGGKLTDIAQITALMIVLGGTIGAVMVTTPLKTLIRAAKYLGTVFFEKSEEPQQVIEEIIAYATKARKNSIISLEADLDKHRRSVSAQGDFAERGRHGSAGAAQDDGAGSGSAAAQRRSGGQGLRSRRRLRAHHRHHRRGAGPDPGDEASGEHRGSGPRNRRRVCGHRVRRRLRESVLPAGRQQNQSAPARNAAHQGTDAGRRLQHRGRHEPQADSHQAGALSPRVEAPAPQKANAPRGGPRGGRLQG